MAVLDIRDVSKVFGAVRAVESFDLTVGDGELVCLLGPSGSGKSTLLRMVGGFETPTSGIITIDGEDVTRLSPEKRPTGMVFQSHALWTHMNVFRNLAFGLKLRRLPKDEITPPRRGRARAGRPQGLRRADDQPALRRPAAARRARPLASSSSRRSCSSTSPSPASTSTCASACARRSATCSSGSRITTLFVTHGQDEALALADRIVVMRDGRTEQIAPPDVLYREPATPFVAGFIGTMNLIEGTVAGGAFRHAGFTLPVPVPDGPATLAVRPEALGDRPRRGRRRRHRPPRHRLRHPRHRRHRARRRRPPEVDGPRRPRLDGRHGRRPRAPRLRPLPRQRRDPPQRLSAAWPTRSR